MEHSATELADFCRRNVPRGAHLVGHSLGGLLILRMLQETGWNLPGRLLFLGTPLKGSAAARRAASWPWPGFDRLLGHAEPHLGKGHGSWPTDRESGMIAGTRSFGLGILVGGLERPNDGTVVVAETRHSGLTDRVEMPVTHTGMLYSGDVARQAAAFLQTGRFSGPA